MLNMAKIPQDCSAETLFPEAEKLLQLVPFGYALQSGGPGGLDIKIPYFGTEFDPCEDNHRRPDGIIEHDYYICLCKWVDGSPITFRFRKTELYSYSWEK